MHFATNIWDGFGRPPIPASPNGERIVDIKGPLDLATAAIAALLIAFTYAASGTVAACRRHSAAEKIALLNLLLGWTLLGWVVLLA